MVRQIICVYTDCTSIYTVVRGIWEGNRPRSEGKGRGRGGGGGASLATVRCSWARRSWH